MLLLCCPINHPSLINRPTVPRLPSTPTLHLAQPCCPAGMQCMATHVYTLTVRTRVAAGNWPQKEIALWLEKSLLSNFVFFGSVHVLLTFLFPFDALFHPFINCIFLVIMQTLLPSAYSHFVFVFTTILMLPPLTHFLLPPPFPPSPCPPPC